MLLEVCVQNLEDALIAEQEGADRIELCASLETGGITPSAGLISEVVKNVKIPVHVLVRSRGGDFCYTPAEFRVLLEDIRRAIDLGASGIVTGILDQSGNLNFNKMERIYTACKGLHLTFHRAFDLVSEPFHTLDQLEAIGVDTVLTSGQRSRAIDALDTLVELKDRSHRISIMPGGGIRPDNIRAFKNAGFQAIHFSGTRSRATGNGKNSEAQFSIADLGSSSRLIMEVDAVRDMIRSVK